MEFDFAVIGSGFGGSVSALRLAEKGYSVVVLEKGKWVTPLDMEDASKSLSKLIWNPALGMRGFFTYDFFRHVSIVGGVGVGGGSIVYAATTLRPKDAFYNDSAWSNLGIDWEKEMKPHYDTASKMLGIVKNPVMDVMDGYLKEVAEKMGAGNTFGPTDTASTLGHRKCLLMIPSSMGRDLHGPVVISVVNVSRDVSTALKTPWTKIIFISPRNTGRQSCHTAKSQTSSHGRMANMS